MKTLEYAVTIQAPAMAVWNTMWSPEGYSAWTSAFVEGSHMKGTLAVGERIHLLAPNGEGMYSNVLRITAGEELALEHLGWIKNFEEQPMDDSVKKWSGAIEAYHLAETNGITTVSTIVDTLPEYVDFMVKTIPVALRKLKDLCEQD
jgi:uncharacterized protein YndB with AHSA1/START domain